MFTAGRILIKERKIKNERINFHVKTHDYCRARGDSGIFQRADDPHRRTRVRHGDGLHKRHGFGEEVGRAVKQHRHYGHRQKGRVPRSRRRRYGCRLPDFLGACARRYRDTDKLLLCHDHRHMADRQRADIYSREPRRARRVDSRFSETFDT